MRLSFLSTLALLATVGAQTPQQLVGITDSSELLTQDLATCSIRPCKTLQEPLISPATGGTAVDANKGWIWLSKGASLWAVEASGCRVVCKPHNLGIGNITALAFYEPKDTLVIATDRHIIYTAATSDRSGPLCPVRLLTKCDASSLVPTSTGTRNFIGGLAVDDAHAMVIYTVSDFAAGAQASTVYVAQLGSECRPICRFPLRACGNQLLGPLTGAAFDPCKSQLFVTDGGQVSNLIFPNTIRACQTHRFGKCCPVKLASGGRYVGLCLVPSQSTLTGRPCLGRPCPQCTTMKHTTSWAAIGSSVSFSLDSAPAQSRAWLMLGLGPCSSPGITHPLLCGPLYTVPLLTGIGPLPTNGGLSQCDGHAGHSLSIPANPSLCGAILSSQFVVLCSQGGLALSNCASTAISGS